MSRNSRTHKTVSAGLFLLAVATLAAPAWSDLSSVQVGGEFRTRGRWYINTWSPTGRALRIGNEALVGRPIGGNGVSSLFKWDNDGADWCRAESSVLLNVRADFTEDVSAFVELYDLFVWSEDFRSNYMTGADSRATSGDDLEINQAYVETREMFGAPLSMRVGRQNLRFGKGWLVNEMLTPTQYLSFDALRVTYAPGDFVIDAFASKIAERATLAEDDADFYGVHGTYNGFKPLTLSAYWFYVRDKQKPEDTSGGWLQERAEDFFDVDDYGVTHLHTVGLRANGMRGGFDYDLELAYQFGEADALGGMFVPVNGIYGDDRAEFDNWATELGVGYTFQDVAWKPRPYVQGMYFGGEDHRAIDFLDWVNPFDRPRASVSFNRLFSDRNYMATVNDNGWLSNCAQLAAGVLLTPTEKIKINFQVAQDYIVQPFDFPWSFRINHKFVPIFPDWPFLTKEGSNDLGWEVSAWLRYDYSKDLYFFLYLNYLNVGEGLADGAFVEFYGTDFNGGSDSTDAGYIFWMTVVKF